MSRLERAERILRKLVADVDAMRCEAPFDIRQDMPEEADHWFGTFEQTGLDTALENPLFQWPNLSILATEAKTLLEAK